MDTIDVLFGVPKRAGMLSVASQLVTAGMNTDACGLAEAEMCLALYPGVVRHPDTRLKCVLHATQ